MKRAGQTHKEAGAPINLLFPKTLTKIGCWNVRTLYETGRAAQVAMEMDKYQMDILGLSEVRWTTSGKVTLASGHTLIYSGAPNEEDEHKYGVALMMTKKAAQCLLEWEPINERILKARFHSKFRKVTIIQCYAPTNLAESDTKDQFYQQLQETIDSSPKRDIIMILGDLNAKVGTNNQNRELNMGKHGTGEMNENGELFADFCVQNDLVIGGTIFKHRNIHKVTWISPDHNTHNQIDHICISRKWRRSLIDVRAYRGADVGSDHILLIGKLRVKIKKNIRVTQKRTHFDTDKLTSPEHLQNFVLSLKNRFQVLADLDNSSIEDKWKQVKNMYNSVSQETLGVKKREFKQWLSEDTIKKITERRNIKKQLCQARTRTQKSKFQKMYTEKNREVKKGAKQDKRNLIDSLAQQAEIAAKKNDTKTLYKITRQLSGKQCNINKPLTREDGKIISNPSAQLELWREHFQNVLNGSPMEVQTIIEEGEDLDINLDPITKEELKAAILKTQNGKAHGPDNIPPEVLKADPDTTADIMLNLINEVWEQETTPAEWSEGYIVKLPKKGDLSKCQNWRGIQLLSLPSKILTRIILERLRTAVDSRLRENQAGFRTGRSCIDQIATLRIIIEQSLEWQSPLYICFVDFKRAFDTIDREVMWKILKHYGIPNKIIKIIRSLYTNTSCRVIHNGELSNSFEVNTGVRQGCLLSPILFSMVIDWVMKNTTNTPKGIQWSLTEKLEDLDFADDISLLAHSYEHMQEKIAKLQEIAQSTGLEINIDKTKAMRVNATNTLPLLVKDQALEEVNQFTYLGSIVSHSGGTDEDVKARINKARQAFAMLRPVWRNSHLSHNTKLRVFSTCVKSVLTYGAETWRHTKIIDRKINVFILGCLRRILKIRWDDFISNEKVEERAGQKPILRELRKRKWKWIGHTLRRKPGNIARQALEWNPQGTRKRGRPSTTWRRTLDKELKEVGMQWKEMKRLSQDRKEWLSIVEALCLTEDLKELD